MLRDLLVHVDSTDLAGKRLRVAAELAALHGARLTGLFAETLSLGPSIVGLRDPERIAEAAAHARERFEAEVATSGVPSRWWRVEARDNAELVDWTVQSCRYVDLAVFGTGEDDRLPQDLVEEVVLESGRPVLAIPPRVPVRRIGEIAVVAWTGSRASARALNDALPFLRWARQVLVLSLQLPGPAASAGKALELDVAAHLRAHGIPVRLERFILGELGAVDHVLNRSTDLGADLIVMGAHGGRGLAQAKHEDSTAAILRSLTAPVLLSH